jgi:hypothetical protein
MMDRDLRHIRSWEDRLVCSVAAAIIGASVVGGGASLGASFLASNAQENAAKNATNTELQMFNTAEAGLQPYIQAGNAGENSLLGMLPGLEAPINMNEATLEATPGYQFTLGQGLKSVQSSAAARGLASSGAALKGAASYATGLADTTYQQQFQNALANKEFALTSAMAPVQIGESAAAGQASAAVNTGSNIGSNLIGAGNAAAAGLVGGANALSSSVGNIGNLYLTNALMQGMYGNSLFGGGAGSSGGYYGSGGGAAPFEDPALGNASGVTGS